MMTDVEREVQIREEAAHWHYHPDNDEMVLLRLLDEARAEIARLQAPPGTPVIERAKDIRQDARTAAFKLYEAIRERVAKTQETES